MAVTVNTISAENEEWDLVWTDPTPLLRMREGVGLEQRWIIRGKTKVKYEWRPVPVVPFDAPSEEGSK
ncbi:hypothetical protein CN235_15595 [Sinorhizobium meliloti]|uniref:hypothetical protein n=1 Tax=Rhizobium meliloti TaxID=382 RepID=UPI000FD2E944|nr:hypothetical protein [Sinorhizobium meliloti]MDW9828691.1 hypothetical protein [Sinorhizobium meliloti]RVE94004.1 hypothetical protein CN235_15595 [Sinorhizobium meliloti]